MKAMEYMLEGLDKSISYDELGNVSVETSNLKWYNEERLSGMGVRRHCGNDYIFISREDCDIYNEYESQMSFGILVEKIFMSVSVMNLKLILRNFLRE